jgi:hypothetical protein
MKDDVEETIPVILIFLAIWFFWPSEPPDEWRGFFYPDKDNLSKHIETGIFDSLEECRDVTTAYGDERGIPPNRYDYECGLNCEREESVGGLFVCEETLH